MPANTLSDAHGHPLGYVVIINLYHSRWLISSNT